MICTNRHNSEPLTELPSEDNEKFLAELNAYNAEMMLLMQDSAIITKTGEDLDNLLKAGVETLSAHEQANYLHTLELFAKFCEQYQARVVGQIAREKALKVKAKQLGMAVDFRSLANPENN